MLNLDCRIKENREIVQKTLRGIKPLSKCPEGKEIPFEKLERCILVLSRNYNLYPKQIVPDVKAADKDILWRFELIDLKDLKTIGICYGLNLYELMCKATIMMYAITRNKEKNKC